VRAHSSWLKSLTVVSILAACFGGVVATNTSQGSGKLTLKAADPTQFLGSGGRRRVSKYSDDIFWTEAGQRIVVHYNARALRRLRGARLQITSWPVGHRLRETTFDSGTAGGLEVTVPKGGIYKIEVRVSRFDYPKMTGHIAVHWQLQ
jgi:hypothetical protein